MFIRALDIIMSVRAQRLSKADIIKANRNNKTALVQYYTSGRRGSAILHLFTRVHIPVQGTIQVQSRTPMRLGIITDTRGVFQNPSILGC